MHLCFDLNFQWTVYVIFFGKITQFQACGVNNY